MPTRLLKKWASKEALITAPVKTLLKTYLVLSNHNENDLVLPIFKISVEQVCPDTESTDHNTHNICMKLRFLKYIILRMAPASVQ